MPDSCAQQKVKMAASAFFTKVANDSQSSHNRLTRFFPGPIKSQPWSDMMCGF